MCFETLPSVLKCAHVGTERMRQHGLNACLWAGFGILILIGGYVALNACDFGTSSLSASGFCHALTENAALQSERAKEAQLQSRIHTEEIRLALLPDCPTPSPKP